MARKKKTRGNDPRAEYDFHGLTASEAEMELLDILDRHQGSKGSEIAIIHGKGAGVLADEVERIARADSRVASHDRGFLNPGVTVLTLNGRTIAEGSSGSGFDAASWNDVPEPRVRGRKR